MARRRRSVILHVWCCAPLVVAACGDDSSGPTLAGSSAPAVTPATTNGRPTTDGSPNSSPEATMPTTDRPATPEPVPEPVTSTTGTSTSSTTTTSTASNTPRASSNVEIATADVRVRVGANVDIELVSDEEVTWPNGGLGCPEPGMSYTQALVNGQRIVLRADGVDYEYHSGKNRPAFYCPPHRITPPATGSYGDV